MNRMDTKYLRIKAPSRLHFGLFSFGDLVVPRYGGVGVMVDAPATEIEFLPASNLRIEGPRSNRVRQVVENWFDKLRVQFRALAIESAEAIPIQIAVNAIPPPHSGFGSGTQLALAVARGISEWFFPERPFDLNDAIHLGRANRSAIGTHGFFHGGLLLDGGKSNDAVVSPLEFRADVPSGWRVVVACPRQATKVFGEVERTAFDRLDPVSPQVAESLRDEVETRMLPALAVEDFDRFSQSVYAFGLAVGGCFEKIQGGPYNGTAVERLVRTIRNAGVPGVAQSSWGPAVFAWTRSESEAVALVDAIRKSEGDVDCWVTQVRNRGVDLFHSRPQKSQSTQPN